MDALRTDASGLAEKLAAATVTIEVRVGEGDKLYGSVTTPMIADKLEEQGIVVDRKKIILDDPIRTLGVHEVSVKLHADVRGTVRVLVCRQGEKLIEGEAAPETAAEESGQPSGQSEA